MKRILLILCILLCLIRINAASAASVYKCKDAHGTTIYQNDPCPQNTVTVAKGAYQRQPDDTRNQQSAATYTQQEHARLEYEAAVAAQRGATESAMESKNQSVSSTAAWNAQVEANSYESRIGHNGPVRTKGQAQAAALRSAQIADAPMPEPMKSYTPPAQPPEVTDCRSGPGGAVDCYNSNGNNMWGHVGPNGTGEVSGADGSSAEIRKNPLGQSTTDNGTCVRDQFGQCK